MNIFTHFLKLLQVKYTSVSEQKYNEHPFKNNLLGISLMLKECKIPNAGFRVKEKNVELLDTPFIVYFMGDFALVKKYDSTNVYMYWQDREIIANLESFYNAWDGTVLIAEPNETSIEHNYYNNRKHEFLSKIKSYSPLIFLIPLFAYIILFKLSEILTWSIFMLNLIGIYICYLLLSKQLQTAGKYVDKICTLFSKSDCNSVLDSKGAKIFGIGWSEIGISYFFSNILIISFFPELINHLALISLLVLFYSFWSIWYQWKIVKQWCPLCLVVQLLFCVIVIVSISAGLLKINLNTLFTKNIILLISIYTLPLSLLVVFIPMHISLKKTTSLKQTINSFNADRDIFYTLLQKQPYYEISHANSNILFGNKKSDILITILTNPYCAPCARMHERINNLLKDIGDKICVQYIFSYFDETLKIANYGLTNSYINNNGGSENVFNKWFTSASKSTNFFVEYGFDKSNIPEKVLREIELHDLWRKKHKEHATPTIFINGFKLMENYMIEDIKYIINNQSVSS